jgi:hypothetical protein
VDGKTQGKPAAARAVFTGTATPPVGAETRHPEEWSRGTPVAGLTELGIKGPTSRPETYNVFGAFHRCPTVCTNEHHVAVALDVPTDRRVGADDLPALVRAVRDAHRREPQIAAVVDLLVRFRHAALSALVVRRRRSR